TVRELGLDGDQARPIDGLLSAALTMPLSLSAPAPEVAVTVGPVGPRTVRLSSSSSIWSLAGALQHAIRSVDPAPGFRTARVLVAGSRLLVLAGPLDAEITEYLRIEVAVEEQLDLDAA